MTRTRALALLLSLLPATAHAQPLAAPTPLPPPGAEQPALGPGSAGREDLRSDSGTTIVGERESPIGLYITPWRNAYAEQDIDRPARLLQVDVSPLDRDVFARQVEYYSALSEAREGATPAAAPAPAAPAAR